MGLTQQDRFELMAAAGGLADEATSQRARALLGEGSPEAVALYESARRQAALLDANRPMFDTTQEFPLSAPESLRLSRLIERRYASRARWNRMRWAAVIGILLVPVSVVGWLLRPASSFTVAWISTSQVGTTDESRGRLQARSGDMLMTSGDYAIGRLPDGSLMVLGPQSTVAVESERLVLQVGMVFISSTTPVIVETESCRLQVTGDALFRRHEAEGNVISVWAGEARLTRGTSSSLVVANQRLEFGKAPDFLSTAYPVPVWATEGIRYATSHGM